MFSGDSFRSFAMVGSDVLRIVESNICIKMEVAKMIGNNFFVNALFSEDVSAISIHSIKVFLIVN